MMKTKFLLLAGLLLATFSCKKDKPSIDLQKGLVSYFNFDDNLKDQKGYASDGIPTGNPTFTAGKIGKAITFNGTNQSLFFTASPQQAPTGFSYSIWINYSPIAAGSVGSVLLLQDKNFVSNTLVAQSANTLFSFLIDQNGIVFIKNAAPNTWLHIALTFDGTVYKTYLNGNLVNNVNRQGAISGFFSSLELGYIPAGVYLNGSIDELYIYNRALSQAEVTQLYNLK